MGTAKTRVERLFQLEQLLLAHPQGLSRAEIARRLGVSRSTVARYIAAVGTHVPVWEDENRNLGIDRNSYVTVRLEKYRYSPQDLLALIAQGEGERLEFKVTACWNEHRRAKGNSLAENIARVVAGFMNAYGGLLLIGVTDDGDVLGLANDYRVADRTKQNRDGYELFLRNNINDRLGAGCIPFYDIDFEQLGGKDICCIKIRAANRPIYLEEELYVRNGNQTRLLKTQEAVDYVRQRWG
jgi:transcriptional regulator with XRE-family HTH domain